MKEFFQWEGADMIPSLYEPFKKWSERGSVWLISDPHFDDLDCKLMNENWVTPEEHVNILNRNIHKNDTLVCLGDCGNLERFKELKCQNLILIKGNHDDKGNSKYAPYFKEVYSGALFISPQILLSHEPVYGLKFCCNIHGHEHNGVYDYTDREGGKHLNIASDVIQWQPVNLGKLIKCGLIAELPTIHRLTIDRAIENSAYKELKKDKDFADTYTTWIIAYCLDTDSFFVTNQRHFFWEYNDEFQCENDAINYFRNHLDEFRSARKDILIHTGGWSIDRDLFLENTKERFDWFQV